MADPDTFVGRVGSLFTASKGKPGGGRSLADIEASLATEEDDKKAGYRPAKSYGGDRLPKVPLATYAHGYSYSQGRYPGGVPRYFEGHDMLPAQLPPHMIATLQRGLVEAGLLDNPRWGFWDESSQDAYRQALSEANMRGVDVQSLLTEYGEAAAIGTQEAAAPYVPEPMRIQVPNKKDVEKVFREAVVDKLGVGMSAAEISNMADMYLWKVMQPQADAYRQMEQYREQAYNYEAGLGPAPTTRQITEVDVMSPETFVDEEARRRDPGGYQARQIGEDYAPAFFEALGGFV